MKQCPIAAKITGSIGIRRAVFETTFSHRGMNVCPVCGAFLIATILCVWEIWSGSNNRMSCIMYFTGWPKKGKKPKKLVTALILKPTYGQKPETFFGLTLYCVSALFTDTSK